MNEAEVSLPFVVWVVALPLAAAIVAFLLPRAAAAVGLVATGLMAWPTVGLVIQLVHDGAQRYSMGGWAAPLGISLGADGLTVFLVTMVSLVGSGVSLYAAGYFASRHPGDDHDHQRASFWILWLLLWAALNALFVTRDLFNAYVTLELIGLAAVALVALADAPAALAAAMRYLLVSLLGSLVYLLGVALTYATTATLDFEQVAALTGGDGTAALALGLMTAGLAMKAAIFPLHFWLPPAHANAPPPVSALLSALVVKASFYLLLRLWFEVFDGVATEAALQLLGGLGGVAVLWGSYQAMRQRRLKLLVAYSTVAQLGYLFLIFPLAGTGVGGFTAWAGGLYFVLAHACAKTTMFLSAGNLMRAAGHDRLADLGSTARALPASTFAFALASISIVGLPPSGGFIAKWLLLNAAIGSGQWWWVIVMGLGTLMAAAYVLRVLELPFGATPDEATPPRTPMVMTVATVGLALVAIGLGLTAPPIIEWLRVEAPVSGPLMPGGAP